MSTACSQTGRYRSPAVDNRSERVVRINRSKPNWLSTRLIAALAVAVRISKLAAAAVILRNSATFITTCKSSNSIYYLKVFENVSFIVRFKNKVSMLLLS